MKALLLVLSLALVGSVALAETWNGTLMDQMCSAKKEPASHTRQCAIACAKSGYGILTADGKYVKFDAAGNKKALAVLTKSTKESDLKATVTGTLQGDVINVATVALQ